jgi:hypothetical protein
VHDRSTATRANGNNYQVKLVLLPPFEPQIGSMIDFARPIIAVRSSEVRVISCCTALVTLGKSYRDWKCEDPP